jgi:mRNA-degrading endonuclease RelE of RelBE toxin-antitoxin system
MSQYRFIIAGPAARNLKRTPQPWRDRIEKALDTMVQDPFRGRKLRSKTGTRRIRIWPYRIVYKIHKTKRLVEIVQIGHRGGIHY